MKEKILELIYKEIENVGSENIFHDCYYSSYYNQNTPYCEKTLVYKSNCDGYVNSSCEQPSFTLKFEDGEPNILVYNNYTYTTSTEVYKTKYFGFKKLYTTINTYTYTTKVVCGHIRFDLTDEQSAELMRLTKEAYTKHLALNDAEADKKIARKINNRLKKHKNK